MNKPQGIAVDEHLLCGCCVGDGQIRAWVDEAETGNDNRRLLKPAAGCPPVERGPSVVAQITSSRNCLPHHSSVLQMREMRSGRCRLTCWQAKDLHR